MTAVYFYSTIDILSNTFNAFLFSMLIAHKIELRANNKQQTSFTKACGVARFSYNWALDYWKILYQAHKANPALPQPTESFLRKELNAIKHTQFPFMLEVTKCAPEQAIKDLGKAFKNFWAKLAGYPQFRKKGQHDSFYIANNVFEVVGNKIKIPKLGWVKMAEELRFSGKIMSATVSRTADKWFVSITVEIPDAEMKLKLNCPENQSAVGVDLGVSALATLSNGEIIYGTKPYRALLKRVRRLSRSLSRKKKGGKNYLKAKRKLARLHARIRNIRQDCLHKLTTRLAENYAIIGIEDLNVKGMMRNHHLAQRIADMGFYEFKQQLAYKVAMRGGKLMIADRWFASSKTCSSCGHKLAELPLSVRQWQCPACQAEHDRDINAACNLRDYVLKAGSKPSA